MIKKGWDTDIKVKWCNFLPQQVCPSVILLFMDRVRLVSHLVLLDDLSVAGKLPKCLHILAGRCRVASLSSCFGRTLTIIWTGSSKSSWLEKKQEGLVDPGNDQLLFGKVSFPLYMSLEWLYVFLYICPHQLDDFECCLFQTLKAQWLIVSLSVG